VPASETDPVGIGERARLACLVRRPAGPPVVLPRSKPLYTLSRRNNEKIPGETIYLPCFCLIPLVSRGWRLNKLVPAGLVGHPRNSPPKGKARKKTYPFAYLACLADKNSLPFPRCLPGDSVAPQRTLVPAAAGGHGYNLSAELGRCSRDRWSRRARGRWCGFTWGLKNRFLANSVAVNVSRAFIPGQHAAAGAGAGVGKCTGHRLSGQPETARIVHRPLRRRLPGAAVPVPV
jgi:hypothetical protein